MAIGRLFYERDQPARAIDAYLNISRRSDLFSDALFEASWVYVKNKEFNKALRALELLALSDPNSYRLPEVRILEGWASRPSPVPTLLPTRSLPRSLFFF